MFDILRRAKNAIFLFFGIIGGMATYFATFDPIQKLLEDHVAVSTLAAIYLGLLICSIVIFFVFREYQTSRKEKYANIANSLHVINHNIRDLNYIQNKHIKSKSDLELTINQQRSKIVDILDGIALVFHTITGTKCRSSIKIISAIEETEYVVTIARNKSEDEILKNFDKKRRKALVDPLSENEKYKQLISPDKEKWHIYCPSVANAPNSTSFTAYMEKEKDVRPPTGWFSSVYNRDPRPYRSFMTCVIRASNSGTPDGEQKIIGFLSVDSEATDAFVERWDAQLLYSFADSMAYALDKYQVMAASSGSET
ncbi:hypothetical protein [Hoeflea alexandrii]|uniref:hypothetical protein n=1 Tax=Hoeflea alexandrii TaxID=288436 RepID=UPI0022B03941|nr:hypothetical protein [Hoeflea alexandrii]